MQNLSHKMHKPPCTPYIACRLLAFCSHVKGSKKYKEGINVLSQSQTSFADFLEEFCGGTDEESMMLGVLTSVVLSWAVQTYDCRTANLWCSCGQPSSKLVIMA